MPSPAQSEAPGNNPPDQLEEWMTAMGYPPGSVSELTPLEERPLHGITLFIAQCTVDTRFGQFRACIFQDVIHKGYLIALTYGDVVSAVELPIRIHSSCLTSETLRGCDCDCQLQLNGALETIAARGKGILFYLMQEGRGVGYLAKARDRMLVQASRDRLSTFQAYACLGLKKDHRSYENVSHICYLLGIKAGFTVLTNNPDKVQALKEQGLTILGRESLEFEPSPFNLAYLSSKAASGHRLNQPADSAVKSALPPCPVKPFRPHVLTHAQRFIYSASYFLPMRPVEAEIVLSRAQYENLPKDLVEGLDRFESSPLILRKSPLRHDRMGVTVDGDELKRFQRDHPGDPIGDILASPYWFQVHVYYNIVTSQEFVVLTYGKPAPGDLPVVRIQSESLFNRFPLKNAENDAKLKYALRHIVHYGVGAIVLLYYDGRGAGFGAYAADRMMTERGLSRSSDESYQKLGVGYDSRDYEASMILLKHHIPDNQIQMVMNSASSLVQKKEYTSALNIHQIDVENWIFLEEGPP